MKLPFFHFYPGDFIYDTEDLSNEEVGIYIRVLCRQWRRGPLHNVSGIPQIILDRYFEQDENGRLYNRRLEETRAELVNHRAKLSKSGRKGAKNRWANGEANGEANANQSQSQILKTNPKLKPHRISELLTQYPKIILTNSAVLRLLRNAFDDYGEKAAIHLLEAMAKLDAKKQNSAPYIRTVIENAPLAGIAAGKFDITGKPPKIYTREEVLAWCDKNGMTMVEAFKGLGGGKFVRIK